MSDESQSEARAAQHASSPDAQAGLAKSQVLDDVIRWDAINWSEPLAFWDQKIPWSRVESCLELGAMRGGLSHWLAAKGKSVVCSDLHDTRKYAHPHHERAGIADRIEYADIDATQIPYENRFDVITFKSVLGDIGLGGRADRQQLAMDQIHRALRPGGYLLFAENATGSALHRFARQRFVNWGSKWRYITSAEMRHFLRAFQSVDLRMTGFLGAFGRSEAQRRILGRMDQVAINHLVPNRWKYLMYGVAQK